MVNSLATTSKAKRLLLHGEQQALVSDASKRIADAYRKLNVSAQASDSRFH
jgi:hypothetical protein